VSGNIPKSIAITGVLYRIGTYLFPVLGKIAELYLDAVDSEEFMTDAYINTTISVEEFEKLKKQGKAARPTRNKLTKTPGQYKLVEKSMDI
jgi:hypothetical protein